MTARACIFGCSGTALTPDEKAFFREANPWGFILFARNAESPDQLARLTQELRGAVDRQAFVFIDQEGGRVQRLKPPHWRAAPPAAAFGALAKRGAAAAIRACWLNYRLIAAELAAAGIDADCAPCLDLAVDGADAVIGDRAFSADPVIVAALGDAALAGLAAGGVVGVVKHMPGHGRADCDSHHALPRVAASAGQLANDLEPFARLNAALMGMTAHVAYEVWDQDRPATASPVVVERIIRGAIGFDGLLLTDDLSMSAMAGGLGARAEAALAAGCDMLLHCNGERAEMEALAGVAPRLAGDALRRADAAEAARKPAEPFEAEEALEELAGLLAAAHGEAAA